MIKRKALSIKQPWASLIIGYLFKKDIWIPPEYRKDIENRNWRYKPSFRGKLLIHSSKSFDEEGLMKARKILRKLGSDISLPHHYSQYERGKILGEVYMNDVVTISDSPWFFGKYGFKMRMPKPIKPIPYKGNLSFWEAEIPESKLEYIEK